VAAREHAPIETRGFLVVAHVNADRIGGRQFLPHSPPSIAPERQAHSINMRKNASERSIKDFFRPQANAAKPSAVLPSSSPALQGGTTPMDPIMISSSGSVPKSAQSSRRIEVKGIKLVIDSDDDSDNLPDVDIMLQAHRSNLLSKPRVPQPVLKKAKEPKPSKHSIDNLLKEVQADRDRSLRINQIDQKLREDGSASYFSTDSRKETAEKLLVSILKDDSDDQDAGGKGSKAREVVKALERTEALQYEPVFHFFQETVPTPPTLMPPRVSLPGDGWATAVSDDNQRDSAFTSGFVSRIALLRPLPVELLQWILDQICFETRQDLIVSYLDAVEAHSRKFPNPLNMETLRRLYTRLGARVLAIDASTIVPEKRLISSSTRQIHPNVRWLLELLKRLAATVNPGTAEFALHTLTLLVTDHTVLHTASLSIALSEAIACLITHLPKDPLEPVINGVQDAIFNHIKDPILRYNIIRGLPITPARAHLFRRRLALAFTLDTTRHAVSPSPLENPALTAHVLLALSESDNFMIYRGRDMDYAALAARIRILDAAIDSGFISLQSSRTIHDSAIDELEKAVRSLTNQIVTSGSSAFSKIDARDAGERLAQRLECAVRLKAKPPKNHYEGIDTETQRQFMSDWAKRESNTRETVEQSNVEDAGSSESQDS
jgi:hypothetical protein